MSLNTKARALGLLTLAFCTLSPAWATTTPSPISVVLSELGVELGELSNYNPTTPPSFKTNDPGIRQTQFRVDGITVTMTGKNFSSHNQISMITVDLGGRADKAEGFTKLFDTTYLPNKIARNRKSWKFATPENLGWQSQETRASLFENASKNYIFTVDRRGIGLGNINALHEPQPAQPPLSRTPQTRRSAKKRNDF